MKNAKDYTKRAKRTKYKLLVVRIGFNDTLMSSAPCGLCVTFLKRLKFVKSVYYSTGDGDQIVKVNTSKLQVTRFTSSTLELYTESPQKFYKNFNRIVGECK